MKRNRPLVGIDLAASEQESKAPGTARLVRYQSEALREIDVPWDWLPTVLDPSTAAAKGWQDQRVLSIRGDRVSVRNSFALGPAWRRAGCAMGYCPNGIVPAGNLPVVSSFFDASLFEAGGTWIRSGRLVSYLILQVVSRYALLRSRRLFVLSDYGVKKLSQLFPRAARKFVMTPCGLIPLPRCENTRPSWASDLAGPFVLFVGIFSDNKNQQSLLRLWSERQVSCATWPSLVLIGGCDPHYHSTKLAPILKRLPRPHQVILPGRVSDADLSWAYSHATAYVQPSFSEGFGLPVIEAMAAGVPVICSNTTSLPEVGGDAVAYCEPGNFESIGRAIESVIGNPKLRQAMVSNGLVRAQKYTWEKNAEIVVSTIKQELVKLGHL